MESEDIFNKITFLLNSNKIPFISKTHDPVKTSEEAAKVRGVSLESGAKAILIHVVDKTKVEYNALIVMSASKKISWGKIKKQMNTKNVAMVSTEEATKLLVI